MNVVLIMVRENGQRRSFALTRDTTIIGRAETADFRIPLSDVSRKHCRLIKDGPALVIEDLGSSNGTVHNGQKIKEMELEAGDTIQIGPVKFIVQIDGSPTEEEVEVDDEAPRVRSAAPGNSVTGITKAAPGPPPSFDSSQFAVKAGDSDSSIELSPD
jgi:pSer/pThr/pTyr-binding forkhead associated (FHA) protein